jgi:DNA-binding transcriptional LysR family regulator
MAMIDRLDPTNLVALHVLLEERHVTRAARRLGITQSSMSHRLARLRDTLQDTLFVRSSAGLLLTPRAQSIAGPLAQALRALEAAVVPPAPFDPATSRSTISIAMPDLLAPLASRLVVGFGADAPLLKVRLSHVPTSLSEALARGEPALALAPSRFVDGSLITRALGDVRFGVIGRRGHRALRGKLTIARWLEHGHVVVRLGNEQSNVIQSEFVRRGLERRVALEVPSFLAGLFAVANSDLLMNAPIPLVHEAATALKLAMRAAPIHLPRVRVSLFWHERFQGDSAHRWARERVFDIARQAFAEVPKRGPSRVSAG